MTTHAQTVARRERIVTFMDERKRAKGIEIAQHFGVSTRAIYRDMMALQKAGEPFAGFAGSGYVVLPPRRELGA